MRGYIRWKETQEIVQKKIREKIYEKEYKEATGTYTVILAKYQNEKLYSNIFKDKLIFGSRSKVHYDYYQLEAYRGTIAEDTPYIINKKSSVYNDIRLPKNEIVLNNYLDHGIGFTLTQDGEIETIKLLRLD